MMRVQSQFGAIKQNQTEVLSVHDKMSLSIAAVSDMSVT